ncbi:hypothetical protein BU24DRAFT_419586 [Aaosphaeria arxii CBS 175.79]|uniref:FAD-binding domain-containing protein n=1 Tax=Aaosphaeria arxii CBS 175.79 TaxID=1450172 RepID=A0A6A5Y3E7_9PLEO|nr:uncharacterized protein BU24DRAFT_419586 [Aaosphaeria arxii CBS 175.79]KAF2019988.1 hypothetical protein BU24DRAFT_419586 [Aaosphaeria arxii CBS 175.79]
MPGKTSQWNSNEIVGDEKLVDVVDLAIVGAGPTGLLSAILARQLGLTVCILDAKEGTIQHGGADALNPRTQQYLEIAGNFEKGEHEHESILDDLLKKGIKCNTSSTFANGQVASRQSEWWNCLTHTFYSSLVMIGQPYIERLFLSRLDTPVHFSEPALSISNKSSSAGVTINTHKRTVNAKYCIAADGARSLIRNELGIEWEGTKPNMVWTVIDCWIETTYPIAKEIVSLELDGQCRMAWIPRERGMQRFYLLMDGDTDQDNVLAMIRKHMAPHPVDITHVEWLSKFEIKERVASSFVHPSPQGPFILAGDSGHVHSVNGGQGLNTGLADAFNLIWRLSLLVKNPDLPNASKDALLGSYELERRATAKEVVDVAAQLVRSTVTEARTYVDLIHKNSGFITGMGVKYTGLDSPLVIQSQRSIFEAGYRCPDLWLQTPGAYGASRLYEKIVYGRFTLLIIGDSPASRNITSGNILTTFQLRPLSRKKEDNDEEFFGCALVKEGESYAVLVRPDTYIAQVGEVEELTAYMDGLLPGVRE